MAAAARRSPDGWKRDIVRQLERRDRNQHAMFRDVIRLYSELLERTSLTTGILSCSSRRPSCDGASISSLRTATGQLACRVLELQQQIEIKECEVEQQHARLLQDQQQLLGALDARRVLQERVEQVRVKNGALKMEYDAMLELQREAESGLREEKIRGGHLLDDIIYLKKQAAARMNSRNERKSRAREVQLAEVRVDSPSSAPTSRCPSPKTTEDREAVRHNHPRLSRSSSATSPRILASIKGLFERRCVHSGLDEDLACPAGMCVSAKVPVRALQVLEAHEQGINAVKFSATSDLLATGGTDRVVKLWDVRAGSLTHRATLTGSTEGITCVDFSTMAGWVLAASYDKSAQLWQHDESVPKLTLTGHLRKVTAARFTSGPHQVVTGSADKTIRRWDVQRAACVQVVEVASSCSDLVCCESCIISGHYDGAIRVWDGRTVGCVLELPGQEKVTSLAVSPDRRQLLSCCRHDCLQLFDLRGRSHEHFSVFRADGFKCGSDSTKAVFSPDGCFLAAGSADAAVYIWNLFTGKLETRLPDKHSSSISAVSWSSSGEYVVSVDKSRLAVLWSGF